MTRIPMATGIVPDERGIVATTGETATICKQLGKDFAKFLYQNAASPFVDTLRSTLEKLETGTDAERFAILSTK